MNKIQHYFRSRPDLTVGLVYFLSLLIVFFPLFNGHGSLNWDAFDLWMPWKHFIVEEFYNGNLPLWNPYHVNGFPQHGDSMTWYPVSWIFGFLNGSYNLTALNYEYIFHVFIAGFGFYKLTGKYVTSKKIRFLLGLSYMFSGFMLGNAQHVSWIISAAWIPWVFYFLNLIFEENQTRSMVLFTITSFFLFSGGYLAIFFVVLYIIIAFITYKISRQSNWKSRSKTALKLFLCFLLIFLLSLPLLYAVIEIFPLFNRSTSNLQDSIFNISIGATPWNGILAIILPFSSGIYNINEIEFGSFSSYFGTAPVIFLFLNIQHILRDKKLLLLAILSIFFLMCSMGDTFPLRRIISHLPLLDLFRYPTLFRLFFIIFSLILLGILLEKLQDNYTFSKKKNQIILISLFTVFIMGAWIIFPKIETEQIKELVKYIFKQKFLIGLNLYGRIFVNLIFFGITTFIILILVSRKKKGNILKILFLFWFIEILLVATTSAPHSVFHPVNVSFANKKIAYQANNYPGIEQNHLEYEQNSWRDYLDFSWQAKTFYVKQFSQNWYNPLQLKDYKKSEFEVSNTILKQLPLFSVVTFDKNKMFRGVIKSDIKFKLIDNQHFSFQNIQNQGKNSYLLFKQFKVPEWEIKYKLKKINSFNLKNGFILIPLDKGITEINFQYKNKGYTITFWIAIASLFILLTLLFFRSKNKIIIAAIALILVLLFIMNSFDRIVDSRVIKSFKNEQISVLNIDQSEEFQMLVFWSKLKSKIMVLQNKAKNDSEISYLEYFYPNKIENITYQNKIYTVFEKSNLKPTIILKQHNIAGNNDFKINLKELISKNKWLKHKVIGVKMIYKTSSESRNTLWISHNRDQKWINGKSWNIENLEPSKNGQLKILIHFIDLAQFDMELNDELNLFLWSEEKTPEFKIKDFEIFETKY